MRKEYLDLSLREKQILSSIISLYILKATPVGSRPLSKYLEGKLNLSPATIRNVMSDLEEMDFIAHPHTSAGRIPTDKGYRFYVDSFKGLRQEFGVAGVNSSSNIWQESIIENLNTLENISADTDEILKEVSKILGSVSKFLSIVTFPELKRLVIQKFELIHLSSNRLLVVLELDSNIVKTITIENSYQINLKHYEKIKHYINDRLQGKTLKFVKDNFAYILQDVDSETIPLVRLFIESIDKLLLKSNEQDKIITSGTQNLLEYPEFDNTERVKSVIELIENDNVIVHILDNNTEGDGLQQGAKVLIGSGMNNSLMEDYSIVLSPYSLGNANGSIGVIGPKRMNYHKIIDLIDLVSKYISIKN